MAKVFGCPMCSFEVHAETEEEVLRKAAQHGQEAHGMEVTAEAREKMREAIRDQ